MAEPGFDYPDPNAAISDPRWHLDASDIPRAEPDTALADVRCKAAAGLVDTWHAVGTTVRQQHIDRDADRFATLAATRDERLATARRVLAG